MGTVENATPSGAERIAAERHRQIDVEGYDAERDAMTGAEQLTDAAIAYALSSEDRSPHYQQTAFNTWWPWSEDAWKPTGDRVRDLTKAGALIAAAIDAELAARR